MQGVSSVRTSNICHPDHHRPCLPLLLASHYQTLTAGDVGSPLSLFQIPLSSFPYPSDYTCVSFTHLSHIPISLCLSISPGISPLFLRYTLSKTTQVVPSPTTRDSQRTICVHFRFNPRLFLCALIHPGHTGCLRLSQTSEAPQSVHAEASTQVCLEHSNPGSRIAP